MREASSGAAFRHRHRERVLMRGRPLLIALAVLVQCFSSGLVKAQAQTQIQTQAAPSVLYVATERLTDLALGYDSLRQVARLGFGTGQQPWHAWFGGSPELQSLVHLPGYQPGAPVLLDSTMLISNRFKGKAWVDAHAALASFDSDGNGIVEGRELSDLYIWVDFNGNGQLADRADALRPASYYYAGFDLRAAPLVRQGHARQGRIRAFAVIVPYGSRIHLLELEVGASWTSRMQGYLAQHPQHPQPSAGKPSPANGLSGRWHWKITNEEQWADATRPWGTEAGGQLLLSVSQDAIHGVVQFSGPHHDRINLPLRGTWRAGQASQAGQPSAEWTSVSPLGLTRSKVRLESLYGQPVLRARSWSNRNGKVREWTWEARYEGPLD